MAKTIEFTASGSCNQLGNFAPGGIARDIPDALAAHLVNEAQCAKYWAPKPAAPAPAPWPPEAAPADSPAPTEPAKPARKTKAKDAAP